MTTQQRAAFDLLDDATRSIVHVMGTTSDPVMRAFLREPMTTALGELHEALRGLLVAEATDEPGIAA